LVVFTDRHDGLVYSLPMLEHLHTLPLPTASSIPPSVDPTGDFLTLVPLHDPANISPPPSARATSPTPSSTSAVLSTKSTAIVGSPSPAKCLRLDTLFNIRRGYHIPIVSLTERKDDTQQHDVPPAPAPVSLGPADWKSWLGGLVGSASVTGDQIDALLAGPDRPVPEKPKPRAAQVYTEWEAGPSKAGATATSTARAKNLLYDRLHSAVAERGEMLGDLETSVNSLEQGSKNMLAQAKLLAAKQTTKSWMPKF